MQIIETDTTKKLTSPSYNYLFCKQTGWFARWGATFEEDPAYCPFGPEIVDIEISTCCSGVGAPCTFCYKANTPHGDTMTLETFETVLDVLPPTVTQLALGIGDIDGNPDLIPILESTRSRGLVPNITVNGVGIDACTATELSQLAGAVGVSLVHRETTLDAVELLCGAGVNQVNVHCVLAQETFEAAVQLLDDAEADPRLRDVHALLFLALKPKGRARTGFSRLRDEDFQLLVERALSNDLRLGFDSCTAPRFLDAIRGEEERQRMQPFIEPCESTCFSAYINVHGQFFPCSFIEDETEWERGVDVLEVSDFTTTVWEHDRTQAFRRRVLECRANGTACPHFAL